MILIAGGTGVLGTRVIDRLSARKLNVRVLTRHPEVARHLQSEHVELVAGDLCDPRAVDNAVRGASAVISAVQGGFGATEGASPQSVDRQGNSNLISAARAHGVERFVLVSIIDAAPDHPLELWRMKHHAEQELKASGLDWTIITSAAFMEWALAQYGEPLINTGRTTIYGRGKMPINFVSADDVAAFVEQAVIDPAMAGKEVKVAGPENLTLNQVVQAVQEAIGHSGSIRHVPPTAMRIMARLLGPIKPALAREMKAGVFLDTVDRRITPTLRREAYPAIPVTRLTQLIQRHIRTPAFETDAPLATSNDEPY